MDEDTYSDRAYAALVKNALAVEDKPLRIVRKRTRIVVPDEPISEASRAQYEYEFREIMFRLLDGGMKEDCGSKSIMPDCCARHATISELGCLEFWDLLNGHLYAADLEERRVA